MTWITNQPHSLKSLWPRRVGVEYSEGPPKETFKYSVSQLQSQGLVGIYVDISMEEYKKLPLAKTPKEFTQLSLLK